MVDTLIRLFPSTETDFSTNGIGVLVDASKCIVIEERNGSFELEMSYPISGRYYEEISLRRIIVAKSNPFSDPQAFRIFQISRPLNGIITVIAHHISYDLSGYPVTPFQADGIIQTLSDLKTKSIIEHPFTFYTDKNSDAVFALNSPTSTRQILGGIDGSILDTYHGEYDFDNYRISLLESRGEDRGVFIRYGKNLTDLEQEENCIDVYTGVYPYWYSEEDGLVELSGDKYVKAEGTYDFTRIMVLDLSSEFSEKPSEDDLRLVTEEYIKENEIGIPKVSLTVSFVQLAQSNEYAAFSNLEKVQLCDIVNVEFPKLNVSATSKCISTTYNVLTDKYEEIELGEEKSKLSTTIAETRTTAIIAKDNSLKENEQTIENTNKIGKKVTGQLGGNIILWDSSGGEKPDELLIMDTKDINTAKSIYRWGSNGLSYSSTGYKGEFKHINLSI